jgi:hypothetical protein
MLFACQSISDTPEVCTWNKTYLSVCLICCEVQGESIDFGRLGVRDVQLPVGKSVAFCIHNHEMCLKSDKLAMPKCQRIRSNSVVQRLHIPSTALASTHAPKSTEAMSGSHCMIVSCRIPQLIRHPQRDGKRQLIGGPILLPSCALKHTHVKRHLLRCNSRRSRSRSTRHTVPLRQLLCRNRSLQRMG